MNKSTIKNGDKIGGKGDLSALTSKRPAENTGLARLTGGYDARTIRAAARLVDIYKQYGGGFGQVPVYVANRNSDWTKVECDYPEHREKIGALRAAFDHVWDAGYRSDNARRSPKPFTFLAFVATDTTGLFPFKDFRRRDSIPSTAAYILADILILRTVAHTRGPAWKETLNKEAIDMLKALGLSETDSTNSINYMRGNIYKYPNLKHTPLAAKTIMAMLLTGGLEIPSVSDIINKTA